MDSQHIAVIIIFDFVVSLPVPDVMAERPFRLVVQSPLCRGMLEAQSPSAQTSERSL